MKRKFFFKVLLLSGLFQLTAVYCQLSVATAQVHAHMKLWDRKYRYPKINSIEFQGDVPSLSMYDAIYGHGAMWESEYVGFRVYMDHRQSIDLYGKKHAQMELDSTNFYSTREHLKNGFGEDILFVGASVGAGSFRGYVDEQPTYMEKVKARGQRVLNEGPDTAIVEIYATDWQYKGCILQFRQLFTMLRGHRDVQVDVWVEGCSDDEVFATGVQKLESDNEGFMRPNGLVGSWGSNIPDKANTDLVEVLGMGVRVPTEYLVKVKEDDLNYLCLVHPVKGHIRYHLAVASDMQVDGGFHDSKSWFNWLRKQWKIENIGK